MIAYENKRHGGGGGGEDIDDVPALEIAMVTARSKLKIMLQTSSSYRVEMLLAEIQRTNLHQECAVLYGKLGQHEQALKLLVNQLGDFAGAEEYCVQMSQSESSTREGRQEVFLTLLRVYLVRGSGHSQQAIDLLNSPQTDLDPSKVLQMVPEIHSRPMIHPSFLRIDWLGCYPRPSFTRGGGRSGATPCVSVILSRGTTPCVSIRSRVVVLYYLILLTGCIVVSMMSSGAAGVGHRCAARVPPKVCEAEDALATDEPDHLRLGEARAFASKGRAASIERVGGGCQRRHAVRGRGQCENAPSSWNPNCGSREGTARTRMKLPHQYTPLRIVPRQLACPLYTVC